MSSPRPGPCSSGTPSRTAWTGPSDAGWVAVHGGSSQPGSNGAGSLGVVGAEQHAGTERELRREQLTHDPEEGLVEGVVAVGGQNGSGARAVRAGAAGDSRRVVHGVPPSGRCSFEQSER